MEAPKVKAGDVFNGVLIVGTLYGAYKVYKALNPDPDLGQGGGGNTEPRVDPVLPPPTMSYNASRILADRIYFAVYGDGSAWSGSVAEDEAEVIASMSVPRNENDVLQLIDAYGVRGGPWWSITGPLNLPATVRQYLSPEQVHVINLDYARRGINIRM